MTEKLAKEIMKEVIGDVTLDTYLDRHPSTLKFPDDYVDLVKYLRADRARFLEAQTAKKAKKEGVEDVEPDAE